MLDWLGAIFLGSTDLLSAEHTSRFIVPFLSWLKPNISPETVASIHFIVRKAAHVSEYAILALFSLRAALSMTDLKRPISIVSTGIGVACLLVAATDEFHQTFVASRRPSLRDIMIDSGGALLGLLLGAVLVKARSIRSGKAPLEL